MAMTREQILQATGLPIETVDAFGGVVRIRALSAQDQFRYEEEAREQPDVVHKLALMAIYSIVDNDGNRMFTRDDILSFLDKSGRSLIAIGEKAAALNGVNAKELEALEKN